MKLSLRDFYFDLFESFKWEKSQVDTQIELDYHRLICNINRRNIPTKIEFYHLLNKLNISKFYKQLIWVIPTQATVYPLLKYATEQYPQYIIAETRDYNPIIIDIYISNHIVIIIRKNFALLKNINDNVETVGEVFGSMSYTIGNKTTGNQTSKNIDLDIKFNSNNFIML